ncbi:MAG: hypothetical protein BGO05_10175 [Rhizobiales bacterium 63-7]|nr:MAG: hypothetical protein BGO05_10175 [Rhizobiales bacterium 63-7]
MIDAVKSAVSEEMMRKAADAFAAKCGIEIYLPDEGSLDDDEQARYDALRDALSAALAAQGQEPVVVKAMEWRKEHQRHHAYALFGGSYVITQYAGMAYPYQLEARGFSGSLAQYFETLIAAKAAAQSDYETRIRSALTAPAQPATDDIADAVLSWMVKHDLLDAGNEYHASDVLAVLDDLAPARPVGVPEGAEDKFARQIWGYLQGRSAGGTDGMKWFDNHKSAGGPARIREIVRSAMLSAAPQPPAEDGWTTDMSSAPKDGTEILGFGSSSWQGKKYAPACHVAWFADGKWWGRDPDTHAGLHLIAWRPLPPAPANGGEQNGK